MSKAVWETKKCKYCNARLSGKFNSWFRHDLLHSKKTKKRKEKS